ncbi:MAG: alanine--tRNA ligase [Deltaproteobacteria bacterium]|nr:alanine--tRNA ligase [Deltaproteobacteria bacterium]
MKAADIRRSFLSFFASRTHSVQPSAALVPANDPSLFFTNAGMVQFKDVFTGDDPREYTRATTVQKCMRVSGKHNDLENVGFTARHHTLFEMLGNFSFGDYFKKEAIAWAWEYLTVEMGLPKERLYVSVYLDDDESYDLWLAQGVPAERIARCGAKDNFWSMGPTGPCGPCTEIHWDLGENFVPDNEPDPWGKGWDAGRIMEIWNLVFMQYERFKDGDAISQRDLPRPSVDTGMGLERLASIVQGHTSSWEIDEFQTLIGVAGSIAGTTYGENPDNDVAMRVIADHARAAAFLIADGVMPASEDRGYVLRRVMRRAIRYGVKLGINRTFLHEISDTVVDLMSDTYPELTERRDFINKVVLNEETAFRATLDRGLTLIEAAFETMRTAGETVLGGETTFQLHDTFGFPPDLTEVIAGEQGFTVDMAGYQTAMEAQRSRGRDAWKGSGETGVDGVYRSLEESGPTEFSGYGATVASSTAQVLLVGGERRASVGHGEDVEIVVAGTPFYAESGGQIGDHGVISWDGGSATVHDVVKPGGTVFVHRAHIDEGVLAVGDEVTLTVDAVRRGDIERNHTATHLLHAALREVLGTHVQQKGSFVGPERLRFDFSHFGAVTTEELETIEDRVNEQILANTSTHVSQTSMADAKDMGAMALFGEKYGDVVRVVQVPGFSTELCGGTHCTATGQIGLLKVVSEGGIAAGVRRIEAISGRGAVRWARGLETRQSQLSERLKTPPEGTLGKVERLLEERKSLQRQVEELKQQLVTGGVGGGPEVREIGGVQVIATVLDGVSGKELRGHGDALLDKLGSGVVVLGAADGAKASLLVKVSKDLTDRVKAGDLVRVLAAEIGGKGGGRPDMAQAGGREPGNLPVAIEKAWSAVEASLA